MTLIADASPIEQYVTKVTLNNMNYYLYIVDHSNTDQIQVELLLRQSNNASSIGDLKMALIKGKKQDFKEFLQTSCKFKTYYDNAKTVVGCLNLIGSAFCAVSTIPTEGATAFICTSIWEYTGNGGAADCIKGASQAVAQKLGEDYMWSALVTGLGLKNPQLIDAISKSIDFMCDSLNEKQKDATILKIVH